jgi:hypothetical protein
MAREGKSARELAEMIAARMKIDAGLVSVHKDPAWDGLLMCSLGHRGFISATNIWGNKSQASCESGTI